MQSRTLIDSFRQPDCFEESEILNRLCYLGGKRWAGGQGQHADAPDLAVEYGQQSSTHSLTPPLQRSASTGQPRALNRTDLNHAHDWTFPDHPVFYGHATSAPAVLRGGRAGDHLVLLVSGVNQERNKIRFWTLSTCRK